MPAVPWFCRPELYASGKAFIPPIRRDLLGKLSAVLEASGDTSQVHKPTMADPGKAAQDSVPQGKLPRSCHSLDVDHIVLVDYSPEFGWRPLLVLKRDDQVLTLPLRDHPDKGCYVRHFAQVAPIISGPA